jgi:uncharacterized iron-regulated protein
MKNSWMLRVCAWSVGAFLLMTSPIQAETQTAREWTIVRPGISQPVNPDTILQQLSQADVVYLGETHDRPADHVAQLKIIQALQQRRAKLAIGMEMFQRPYQFVLNQYLAGKLSETELLERSEYQTRWGFPWKFYAPIVQFAKTKQLPIMALNTPREVTRKVARNGLESLTLADKRFIPPLSEVLLTPESYRQRIRQIYDQMHQGKGNNTGFDRFFQAQVLWDETMAESIAQTLKQNPGTLVVVLVGQGHLPYGEGVPNRVARRMQAAKSFTQVSVLLNPPEEFQQDKAIADYFLYLP